MLHNYLIIALRNIRKSKLHALMNILGLAAGLAVVVIIVLFIYSERSSESQHEKANSIYRVGYHSLQPISSRTALSSFPMGPALKRDYADILDYVRLSNPMWFTDGLLISHNDKTAMERGVVFTDTNFFCFFDYEFIYGSPENALSEPHKIVLTEEKSMFFFGDSNPVGQILRVGDGHPMQISGVIRPSEKPTHLRFHYMLAIDAMDAYLESLFGSFDRFSSYNFYTYLHVNEGFNPEDFNQNQLEGFLLRHACGNNVPDDLLDRVRFDFKPLRAIYFDNDVFGDLFNPDFVANKGNRTHLMVFGLLAIFLTAIAAINYTNMAISRSLQRSKEVGVRKVLGSGRSQLIKQHYSETAVFVIISLFLALLIADFFIPSFNAAMNKGIALSALREPQMIIYLAVIVILLVLSSGSYPAFYLSAISPVAAIKGQHGMSSRTLNVKNMLLGFQLFVSVFIIIITLFVYQQFNYMQQKDPGFATHDRVSVTLPSSDRITPEWISSFKAGLLQNPDILKASSAFVNPLPGNLVSRSSFPVDGDQALDDVTVYVASVDPDYFDVYEISIREGRSFSWDSPGDFENGVLFNETAMRDFGWEDAVGKTIYLSGFPYRILGIVADFHFHSYHQPIEPLMLRTTRGGRDISMVLNQNNISGGLSALESTWQKFLPGYPFNYKFVEDQLAATINVEKASSGLLAVFAVFSVLISLAGLFGLVSFTAMQRTREIALRRTFGAKVPGIILVLSKGFFRVMGIAFLLAMPIAYLYTSRWLESFAYRISITPWPFIAAMLLAICLTVATVTYHVLKSSAMKPINALNHH